MGLVLDSGVLIATEREKRPVSKLLAPLPADLIDAEFLLQAISVRGLDLLINRGSPFSRMPSVDQRFTAEVIWLGYLEG